MKTWLRKFRNESGAIATSTLDLAAATAGAILLTLSFVPVVTGVMETAKTAKARSEVQSVAEAVNRFHSETTVFPARDLNGKDNVLVILHSLRPKSPELKRPDGLFDGPLARDPMAVLETGWGNFLLDERRDAISNHLIDDGDPGDSLNDRLPSGAERYRNPGVGGDNPVPWRGAYISNISTDPWRRNYLVLVRAFYDSTSGLNPGRRLQGWIISAGPNGILETRVDSLELNEIPDTSLAKERRGDDIGLPFYSAPPAR